MGVIHVAMPGKERHLRPPAGDELFKAAGDLQRHGMTSARLPDGFELPGDPEDEHDEPPVVGAERV